MFQQLLCVVLCILAATLVHSQTCPPASFDSVSRGFEPLKYLQGNDTARAWFIQQQAINAYQPADELFCVRAAYVPTNPSDLGRGITVINTARKGSVTGTAVGSTSGAIKLSAFPDTTLTTRLTYPSATRPSKFRVGPTFLAGTWPLTYGPYWVVAAGLSADRTNYDWAIVTGGPPRTVVQGGGCAVGPLNPGPFDVNGSGFWLFSRRPVDPVNTAIMRAEAQRLGLDLSVLRPVQQQGCTYPALPALPTPASATATAAAAVATEPVAAVAGVQDTATATAAAAAVDAAVAPAVLPAGAVTIEPATAAVPVLVATGAAVAAEVVPVAIPAASLGSAALETVPVVMTSAASVAAEGAAGP